MQQSEFDRLIEPFYTAVEDGCRRMVAVGNEAPETNMIMTEFVISGRRYELAVRARNEDVVKYKFWLGINVNRIFFIINLADVDTENAKKSFRHTFTGAEKCGWTISCEPIPKGVAIVAICSVGDVDLCHFPEVGTDGGKIKPDLTKKGLYWATDICLMVQSLLRSCDREGIRSHAALPAPL